ncbi:MAG TPA: hypothetical protein VHX15_04855 [Frankiaceae bacterium]|jgi:hypothetical protein|nr:hypothetical protein [Frankiaceae bacterium]
MARSALTLCAAIAIALGAAAPVAAAEAEAPAYQHFVACGLGHHAKPSHHCPRRSAEGAFFRTRRDSVHYTVCVRFPEGRTLCAKHQEADRGVLYVNALTTPQPGLHRITWFVEGKRVGRYYFRIGTSNTAR